MEKRLMEKMDFHSSNFKKDIQIWLQKNECMIQSSEGDKSSEFLKFIFDYNRLEFDKTDFLRRKRSKNTVPDYNRCCALRANKDRCSRKRKNDNLYCGTHMKGIPHGSIESKVVSKKDTIEIWIEEIKGIMYYIDANNNIYCPEDILNGITNPRVVSRWIKEHDKYQLVV